MRENMPKKERKFDSHSIPRRLNLLFGMVIILFVTLIGRLAYMQVFNQDFYTKKLATASQTKIKLSSVRGQIYDASGKPLVENATDISNSETIFIKQYEKLINPKEQVLILSAFPHFIIDIFGIERYCEIRDWTFTLKNISEYS